MPNSNVLTGIKYMVTILELMKC